MDDAIAPDASEDGSAPDFWKRKLTELSKYSDRLSDFALDLYEAGRITREDSANVFRACNEVIVYRSGSAGCQSDALSYALYRDGLHQMRRRLNELCPELRDEIEKLSPEGQSR